MLKHGMSFKDILLSYHVKVFKVVKANAKMSDFLEQKGKDITIPTEGDFRPLTQWQVIFTEITQKLIAHGIEISPVEEKKSAHTQKEYTLLLLSSDAKIVPDLLSSGKKMALQKGKKGSVEVYWMETTGIKHRTLSQEDFGPAGISGILSKFPKEGEQPKEINKESYQNVGQKVIDAILLMCGLQEITHKSDREEKVPGSSFITYRSAGKNWPDPDPVRVSIKIPEERIRSVASSSRSSDSSSRAMSSLSISPPIGGMVYFHAGPPTITSGTATIPNVMTSSSPPIRSEQRVIHFHTNSPICPTLNLLKNLLKRIKRMRKKIH